MLFNRTGTPELMPSGFMFGEALEEVTYLAEQGVEAEVEFVLPEGVSSEDYMKGVK